MIPESLRVNRRSPRAAGGGLDANSGRGSAAAGGLGAGSAPGSDAAGVLAAGSGGGSATASVLGDGSGRGSAAACALSVPRGAALYIGALLGPGLLLLPGLAAAEAGPASILAWLGLLCLSALFAVVFSSLGRAYPTAGGVSGYAAAGLGARAGTVAGASFLVGVVCGAPLVCLIGASYVTDLTGGGTSQRCVIAAVLLLAVLALASGGLRASTTAQLVLVSVLTAVIVAAVVGAAPAARGANWLPFAPDGLASIGHAAATLMFSFVGWEAVAPLTGRFRDPARQLPRVIGIALAVTTVLYLGLAIATISVLGRGAATDVPLAGLLAHAVGAEGRVVAAAVAVVLTLGTTNAYLSGAVTMAREFAGRTPTSAGGTPTNAAGTPTSAGGLPGNAGRSPGIGSERPFLSLIAVAGVVLLALYGAGLVTAAELVGVPTTLFLAVYLCCTLSAARTLRGPARGCAAAAFVAVAVLLAFCGWALVFAAVVAVVAALYGGRRRRSAP
jgi:amino acid efflux transporter